MILARWYNLAKVCHGTRQFRWHSCRRWNFFKNRIDAVFTTFERRKQTIQQTTWWSESLATSYKIFWSSYRSSPVEGKKWVPAPCHFQYDQKCLWNSEIISSEWKHGLSCQKLIDAGRCNLSADSTISLILVEVSDSFREIKYTRSILIIMLLWDTATTVHISRSNLHCLKGVCLIFKRWELVCFKIKILKMARN